MAALSDQLLAVTVLAYLAAMLCYAAEYAFRARPARALALAASPTSSSWPSPPSPSGAPRPRPSAQHGEEGPTQVGGTQAGRPGGEWLSRVALSVLLLAAAVHLATAVTRGLAAQRPPWGNMYEYALTITFVAVVAWFLVRRRYPSLGHLGLYVALMNAVLLGVIGMAAYTPVEPLVPALRSAWFTIHVGAAATASGIFLVGFVTAVMYLVRAGYDRGGRRFPYSLGPRIPRAETVERISFRLHAFGFPIWTFAVIAGAIWAEASWGRYWGWDPKEIWAFVSWVVYAAYLHARATPSVKRTVVAWLAVAGWLTIMMNLFGVNLFISSLHSYA